MPSKRARDVSLPGNMRLLSISLEIAAWRPKGVAEAHEGACRDADDVIGAGNDPVLVGFVCFRAGDMLLAVMEIRRSPIAFDPAVRFCRGLFGAAGRYTVLLCACCEDDEFELLRCAGDIEGVEEIGQRCAVDVLIFLIGVFLSVGGGD